MISKDFNKRLVDMRRIAKEIEIGNLDVTVRVDSTDEIGLLGEGINQMAIGLKEKEALKDTFGKVVDPRIRDHLMQSELNLGGELREATVLFADIRSFTPTVERMSPDQVVAWLNRFFEKINHCVEKERGVINKFIGDSVMAVFGVPVEILDHADRAVSAAIEIRQAMDDLRVLLDARIFRR